MDAVSPDVEPTAFATLDQAHRHTIRHRSEVLTSERCGCFYCGSVFPPDAIIDWTDSSEGVGQTALCPQCHIDSVIGSASGFPVTPEFLTAMHARYF